MLIFLLSFSGYFCFINITVLLTTRVLQIHLVDAYRLAGYFVNSSTIVRQIIRSFRRQFPLWLNVRRHFLLIIRCRFHLVRADSLRFRVLRVDVGRNSFRSSRQVEIVGKRHHVQRCGQCVPKTSGHH